MFSKAVKNIIEGNVYQGLEIFEVNGKDYFALLILENRKGELEIVSEHFIETLDGLPGLIDRKRPLFVTFNTSKILKKQVPTESKKDPQVLVINAFPNLVLDNFYYQVLRSREKSVVSIGKKTHIDGYLEQFEKKGITPLQIALGISNIQIFEGGVKQDLVGSNFQIKWKEGIFDLYQGQPENVVQPIDLNGITLQSIHLLGLAQILSFVHESMPPSNLLGVNQKRQNDFSNNRYFELGLQLALGFFLVLLLANFLIFNHYHKKNQELEAHITNNQNQDGSLKILQKRVANKEGRLERILNSKNSKTSYYLDELGKSIPNSVHLSDVEYQPLLTPIRAKKVINLNEHHLRIAGLTNDKVQFTAWADNLEMQTWVNRVEIMEYEYLSKSSANFTLKVILNSNE